LLTIFFATPVGNADGFVLNKGGRYVPEEEQQAFIEWRDGSETLFVKTRTVASTEPTLWILPVPSRPDQVQAEPVAKFPVVHREYKVVKTAGLLLQRSATIGFLADTGVVPFCCAGAIGGCGGDDKAKDVEVHQRTEKLGMVVEVLTARTTAGLDVYLTSKQITKRAADIDALVPYVAGEYSLICAWTADPSVSPVARALRIDFVSPTVFYPLLPTSVYDSPISGSVYVRGWVRHSDDTSNPNTKCHYVEGIVEEINYELPTEERQRIHERTQFERLTRVELPSHPKEWRHDLNLRAGAPAAVHLSQGIINLDLNLAFLLCSAMGIILAPLLALCAIPRGRRGWLDFVWAGAVGAAMGLTVYASAIAFCIWFKWRSLRFKGEEGPTPASGSMTYAWCFFGTYAVYLLYLLGSCMRARFVYNSLWDIRDLAAISLILFIAALVSAVFVYRVYKAAGWKSLWLLAFVALHLGTVHLTCNALGWWLATWE
jgi:hypothetical protein